MKKLLLGLVMVAVLVGFASPALADGHSKHPAVPEQSIGNVNANAANGMHTAWFNVSEKSNGVAAHVFMQRHSPHR
ncbi:hypothetical protein [Salipaludibacillus daqingensis]|uniref:hypothetical protein n=1 Tax=Salipaludibacillus daqingensis TaxID=3041001 RepID=UPI0024764173|nr:hypothetical protein [Salipaludibacillus daqingensis]